MIYLKILNKSLCCRILGYPYSIEFCNEGARRRYCFIFVLPYEICVDFSRIFSPEDTMRYLGINLLVEKLNQVCQCYIVFLSDFCYCYGPFQYRYQFLTLKENSDLRVLYRPIIFAFQAIYRLIRVSYSYIRLNMLKSSDLAILGPVLRSTFQVKMWDFQVGFEARKSVSWDQGIVSIKLISGSSSGKHQAAGLITY